MKDVFVLSASDRDNYGDLIFPLILKKVANNYGYTFHNIALIDSDLRSVGALPTKSFKTIYEKGNKGLLIVGGGEVVGSKWSVLYSYLNSSYGFFYRKTKRFDRWGLHEFLVRFLVNNGREIVPLMPTSKEVLNSYEIALNSVGGIINRKLGLNSSFINGLNRYKYISVRNKNNFLNFEKKISKKVHLVPDSAIVMSDFYLKEKKIDNNYYVLQLGKYKIGCKLEIVKKQVEKIFLKTNLIPYLVVIGNCPGHEDEVPLEWLHKNLDCDSVIIQGSINERMQAIANSKFYLGTSLHGVITAMSFNVPYYGLNRKISKVNDYLNTWGIEPMNECKDIATISGQVEKLLDVSLVEKIRIKTEKQKLLVKNSFEAIFG